MGMELVRVGVFHVDDADVQKFVHDHRAGAHGAVFFQREPDVRVLCVKRFQKLREKDGREHRGNADDDFGFDGVSVLIICAKIVAGVQNFRGAAIKRFALFRERNAASRVGKQRDGKLFFQLADGDRNGGLCHKHFLRGARDAVIARGAGEIAQLVERHENTVPIRNLSFDQLY